MPQATSHSPASAVVSGLEDKAQKLRGLRFISPVLVQVRSGDEFTDPAAHHVRASRIPAEQVLKRALGLLEPRQELVQVRAALADVDQQKPAPPCALSFAIAAPYRCRPRPGLSADP